MVFRFAYLKNFKLRLNLVYVNIREKIMFSLCCFNFINNIFILINFIISLVYSVNFDYKILMLLKFMSSLRRKKVGPTLSHFDT